MNFADRLTEAVLQKENPSVIGLDPDLGRFPSEYAAAHDPAASRAEKAAAMVAYLTEVIEIVAPHVPAVKPQSAFFEVLGADGAQAWETIVERARAAGLLVIGDAKRGDIGSTASAYATGLLEGSCEADRAHVCDALTVNPYLGSDAMQPFLDACAKVDAGLFVLVRTSNPSSSEFQLQGEPPLMERVARAVDQWGANLVGNSGLSSVGAVVGATHPEVFVEMRALMPKTLFLLPGYGAQGGTASGLAPAFTEGLRGAIVNSSRGILYAYQKSDAKDWRDATRAATLAMKDDLCQGILSRT